MTRTPPRLFYGWWIALISACGLFLGPIPIVVFSFGIFLMPLIQAFHTGRGPVSLAFTLFTTVAALGLPFAGRLVDRFGARRVIVPSTLLAGLILLSASFCPGSIWRLYLFYAGLGIAGWGLGPVPYCHVVTHWFDRHRGLALSVMMLGLGLGALVVPSLMQRLIARFGWRAAFEISGAVMLAVAVPILTAFLKDRPEEIGLWPDGRAYALFPNREFERNSGSTWSEAWRSRIFWLLFAAFVLVSASVQASLAHLAAILTDRGATARTAALASSLFGAGVLLGRIGSGYLLDRFFAPRVTALIFGCAAAGIGMLQIRSTHEIAFAAALCVGLGLGAEVDIMAYLTSRYFGLRSFGSIYGVIFAGFGLAGGLGAYLMGAAFDSTHSYQFALALLAMATLTGALLVTLLGPYRYQVRQTNDNREQVGVLASEL